MPSNYYTDDYIKPASPSVAPLEGGECFRGSQLARVLSAYSEDVPPKQRALHTRMLNAEIPAVFVRGRYWVRWSDLPRIAAALGLRLAPRRIPELGARQPEIGLYVRENFDTLSAARGRGISWQEIVAAMTEIGVRGPGGTDLGWRQIASLFYAERYEKSGNRKRHKVARLDVPQPAADGLPAAAALPTPPAT